jgi:hypothetical protein
MTYETHYLIVAGVAWIRLTRVGDVREAWLVTFDRERRAVKEPARGQSLARGELAGTSWELSWDELAPRFRSPHPLLRAVASTQIETAPALAVSGRVGERELDRAPGHTARLWGKRHARTWGWAHAGTGDGRWRHVLTATLPHLRRLSQHARDGRPPGLPFARGTVEPPVVRVGPYTVEADPETFVGLRYTDTDGSTLWCYHSEWARGLGIADAALELAVGEPIAGWTVAL